MKAKKGTQPVVIEVSPLSCNVIDDAGNGIIGFTAVFTDGTFRNITLAFSPETYATVNSEIITIKQIIESSLASITAAKHQINENQTTHNSNKRRQS